MTSADTKPRSKAERPRRISILGATGSIGESTLDLIGRDPEGFDVVALTGGKNVRRLAEMAIEHRAEIAVIADPDGSADLKTALAGTGIEAAAGAYDLVVAMYHDQGLIPVKLLGWDQAVNWTLGLPIIRTSPDHGTAFDIAGKNKASAGSMTAAVEFAIQLASNQRAAPAGAPSQRREPAA